MRPLRQVAPSAPASSTFAEGPDRMFDDGTGAAGAGDGGGGGLAVVVVAATCERWRRGVGGGRRAEPVEAAAERGSCGRRPCARRGRARCAARLMVEDHCTSGGNKYKLYHGPWREG